MTLPPKVELVNGIKCERVYLPRQRSARSQRRWKNVPNRFASRHGLLTDEDAVSEFPRLDGQNRDLQCNIGLNADLQ